MDDDLHLSGPWAITVGAGITEFELRHHVSAFPAVEKASGRVALTLDVWLAAMLRRGIEGALSLPVFDEHFDTSVWAAAGNGSGVVQISGPGRIGFLSGRTSRVRLDDVEAGLSRRLVVEHLWVPSLEHALRPWRDGAAHLELGIQRFADAERG